MHFSLRLAINDSLDRFYQGLPRSIGAVATLKSIGHLSYTRFTITGPLSEQRHFGALHTLMKRERFSMMRPEQILPATSIAKFSRVVLSMIVKLAQASKTKSQPTTA
jgi:hypothetical protein